MPLTYLDCFKILENHFRYVNIGYIPITLTDEEMVGAMFATIPGKIISHDWEQAYRINFSKRSWMQTFFLGISKGKSGNRDGCDIFFSELAKLEQTFVMEGSVPEKFLKYLQADIIGIWQHYSSSEERGLQTANPFLYDLASKIIDEASLEESEKRAKKARLNLNFYHLVPYDNYKKALGGLTERTDPVFRGDSRPPADIFKNGFKNIAGIFDYLYGLWHGNGSTPSVTNMSTSRCAIACDLQPIGASCFPMSPDYFITTHLNSYGFENKIVDRTYIYVIDPKEYEWLDIYRLNAMILNNPFRGFASNHTLVFETIPTATEIKPESIIGAYTIDRTLIEVKDAITRLGYFFYAISKFKVVEYKENLAYQGEASEHIALKVGGKYRADTFDIEKHNKVVTNGIKNILSPLRNKNFELRTSSDITSKAAKVDLDKKIRATLNPDIFFVNSQKGKSRQMKQDPSEQPRQAESRISVRM